MPEIFSIKTFMNAPVGHIQNPFQTEDDKISFKNFIILNFDHFSCGSMMLMMLSNPLKVGELVFNEKLFYSTPIILLLLHKNMACYTTYKKKKI